MKFTYGNINYLKFYFYDIEPIRPNENRKTLNIINAAININSYEVFNGIFSLYNQVCSEIEQRKMEDLGSNILDSMINGDHIDNILTLLTDDLNIKQKKSRSNRIIFRSCCNFKINASYLWSWYWFT